MTGFDTKGTFAESGKKGIRAKIITVISMVIALLILLAGCSSPKDKNEGVLGSNEVGLSEKESGMSSITSMPVEIEVSGNSEMD
jgi:hypothetical protein